MKEADDLTHREQEIIDRALQLQQDLTALQKHKNEALARQLRKQLQTEADGKLAAYEIELASEIDATLQQIASEKSSRSALLATTRDEVERQIAELQSRLEQLEKAGEELDLAASAAEEYVRAEAAEKLKAMQSALARHVDARVQQFSQYLSS